MNIKNELRKAFEASTKAVVSYKLIMETLQDAKISPKDINKYLYSLYPDWPMKTKKDEEKGEHLGLNNTLKDKPDYLPAKYVNAFSVWRSRSYRAGTYDVKTADNKKKKEKKAEEKKGVAVAGSIRDIDVPKYLTLIAELAKKKGNEKAYKMCVELNKVFTAKAVAKPVQKRGKRS
jgi:hypothetical protein